MNNVRRRNDARSDEMREGLSGFRMDNQYGRDLEVEEGSW
jgi:hypothetical protein